MFWYSERVLRVTVACDPVRATYSGVVEGEHHSPKYFLGGRVPPNDIQTRGTVTH